MKGKESWTSTMRMRTVPSQPPKKPARSPEVAVRRARQEAPVLDQERVVEAQALAELVHIFRLDVHRQEEEDGIAAEANQEEHRREREEHHQRRLAEPREHVAAHEAPVVARALSAGAGQTVYQPAASSSVRRYQGASGNVIGRIAGSVTPASR